MMYIALACLAALFTRAETRQLSLRQALEVAQTQNPDLVLTRFDEIRQSQAVRVARDPFALKVGVGSGLGWNNGFPMSIDGAAPSVLQGRASAMLYNRPQKLRIAQELENSRGLRHEIQSRREQVAHRVAVQYLETARLARLAETAARQIASLDLIRQTAAARVAEGRAIPVEELRARVEAERARQRSAQFADELASAEASLALLLGFAAEDRVRTADEPLTLADVPESEEVAVQLALDNSAALKKLQSQILAKGFEVQSHRAARLPKMELFGQYGLFAKFNNYEDYFRTFQRHNGQVGVSVQVPVLAGPAAKALAGQAEAETARLRVEVDRLRNQTSHDTRRAYQRIALARQAQSLARLTLDLAREEVSVALAKQTEGRVSAKELEEARVAENEKWIALYDAQFTVERAQLDLLHQAGTLLAAVK